MAAGGGAIAADGTRSDSKAGEAESPQAPREAEAAANTNSGCLPGDPFAEDLERSTRPARGDRGGSACAPSSSLGRGTPIFFSHSLPVGADGLGDLVGVRRIPLICQYR